MQMCQYIRRGVTLSVYEAVSFASVGPALVLHSVEMMDRGLAQVFDADSL
jgi:hypothetical protein